MKFINILIVFVFLANSSVFAESKLTETLNEFVEIFATLDSEWENFSNSKFDKESYKKLEINFQTNAEKLFAIESNNKNFREVFEDYGNIIIDSAMIIHNRSNQQKYGKDVLYDMKFGLMFLSHISIGTAGAIGAETNKKMNSKQKKNFQKEFLQMVNQKFHYQLHMKKSPFAKSIQLVARFVKETF